MSPEQTHAPMSGHGPGDDQSPAQLTMRRPWLDQLPDLRIPAGLAIRAYRPEDGAALARLLGRAFEESWDERLVRERLTEAPDVEAVYLVLDGQVPVATASARVGVPGFAGSGYLHWVGADPDYQGRGLGALASLRVLQHFRDAGLPDAVLETDTFRLAAQRTYLRLGFVPEYRGGQDQLRWAQLLPKHLR